MLALTMVLQQKLSHRLNQKMRLELRVDCRVCGENIGEAPLSERMIENVTHLSQGGSFTDICPNCFTLCVGDNEQVIKEWNRIGEDPVELVRFAKRLKGEYDEER